MGTVISLSQFSTRTYATVWTGKIARKKGTHDPRKDLGLLLLDLDWA
jgi:hypothetical protein